MLAILSVIATGAALFFGVVAWRLARADRERSEARVALLASVIDHQSIPSAAKVVDVPGLFASRHDGDTPGRPMITAAVVIGIAAVAFIAAAIGSRSSGPAAAVDAGHAARIESTAAPIELTSMRHTRHGSALTVTGLVRNPVSGAHVEGLSAVVLAFDGDGTFITSNRAPIDFMSLNPGDESPFVVTIPRAADVGRYRVTFRAGSGIVRHIDRRQEPQLAAHRGQ